METKELHYCIALTLLEGVGVRSAKTILSLYQGKAENFFLDKKLEKINLKGFSKEKLKKAKREQALIEAEQYVDYITKENINPHFYYSKNYPERLKNCLDAPIILFSKGEFAINPEKSIAIVGTRNMTSYGKHIVEELVESLGELNIQIVSGMAYGVDVLTHKLCLKHNIETVGVLGHGLDRVYPYQHRNIATDMLEREGGLITEFLHGTQPDRENFPKRNRIVAGMTDATIVVESGEKGGSLITAGLANDYNKDVFAFPGNITNEYSKGCNQLIATNKAHLADSAKYILDTMGWGVKVNKTIQRQFFPNLTEEETDLVNIIKEKELSVDLISANLKKPVSKINSMLISLELQGVVQSKPGNKFLAV